VAERVAPERGAADVHVVGVYRTQNLGEPPKKVRSATRPVWCHRHLTAELDERVLIRVCGADSFEMGASGSESCPVLEKRRMTLTGDGRGVMDYV